MKFSHTISGDAASVEIHGDLDSAQCNCLEAFWHCHMPDGLHTIDLELGDVDSIDGESVAILVGIIRRHLDQGTAVALHRPPQMLAHTLYKVGLLQHPGLTLREPRTEDQPYAQ